MQRIILVFDFGLIGRTALQHHMQHAKELDIELIAVEMFLDKPKPAPTTETLALELNQKMPKDIRVAHMIIKEAEIIIAVHEPIRFPDRKADKLCSPKNCSKIIFRRSRPPPFQKLVIHAANINLAAFC